MDLKTILDTAKQIRWSEIKDHMGYVSYDIPSILSDIVNENVVIRKKAYWKLDNHIVVQGGLSESCLYILPFLNELVKVSKFKDLLLSIIFEIVNGGDLTMSNGHISVSYIDIYEPFLYFVPNHDDHANLKGLHNSIMAYIEANQKTYIDALFTINSPEELETNLYILLCFKESPLIKSAFFEAKRTRKDEKLQMIFESFKSSFEEWNC